MVEDRISTSTGRHKIGAVRKRQRYTLVACEKCKRRKIKCSGETPCRQCKRHGGANCVYDRIPLGNSTMLPSGQEKVGVVDELSSLGQVSHPHALWPLSRSEAIELLETLREDVETLYPFIDLREILDLVDIIYSCTGPRRNPGSNFHTERWDDIGDSRNLDFVKLLLSCALSTKRNMDEDLGQRLAWTVEENNFNRLRFVNVDVKDVAISTMLSVYDYRHDDVKLAWRKIGAAAKMCLELGLHTIADPALEDSTAIHVSWGTKMFWCVYVLDRRYSFMANLPFTFQDKDINFELLTQDRSAPYLIPMVLYGRLGGKIIPAVPKFGSTSNELSDNLRKALGNEIDHWVETTSIGIPSAQPSVSTNSNFSPKRQHHFKIFFQVRSNMMRLSLYKHSLYNAHKVLRHQKFATLAVQLATDNVRILSEETDESYDSYESQGLHYRFFLMSSLAVLHLAIRNAPQHFSTALFEYSTGLKTLQSMSASSIASEKFRKTVQILETALNGLKLGTFNLFGKELRPQLDYGIPPIPQTDWPNEKLIELAKDVDHDSRQSHDFATSPQEFPSMTISSTPTSRNSFEVEYNERLPIDVEDKGESALQEFAVHEFGLSDFWNSSSELFWNGGTFADGEFGLFSEKIWG